MGYEEKEFTLARPKIYAILIMRARQGNVQREIMALSITLMTGVKARMGGGWTAITMVRANTSGRLNSRRDKSDVKLQG